MKKKQACRCFEKFCECIGNIDAFECEKGISHCRQCPISEENMGGGLECYGVFPGQTPYKDYNRG